MKYEKLSAGMLTLLRDYQEEGRTGLARLTKAAAPCLLSERGKLSSEASQYQVNLQVHTTENGDSDS